MLRENTCKRDIADTCTRAVQSAHRRAALLSQRNDVPSGDRYQRIKAGSLRGGLRRHQVVHDLVSESGLVSAGRESPLR